MLGTGTGNGSRAGTETVRRKIRSRNLNRNRNHVKMARFHKRAATLPETSRRFIPVALKAAIFSQWIILATPLALNGYHTQQELHWPQLFLLWSWPLDEFNGFSSC